MLVTVKELLERAGTENYAVAAPNITTSVEAEAAIAAAEELHAPLILDVLPEDMKIPYPEQFCHWLRERCQLAGISIAVNLDSRGIFTEASRKMQYGATSLIANCSGLSFDENAAVVKAVAGLAHAAGMSCEAELGKDDSLTDPQDAARFIEITGADCLAVAIGTTNKPEPYVDFGQLTEIKKAVGNYPLVLHGCAGVPMEQLHRACQMGINKVNIASDLRKAIMQAILDSGGIGNPMILAAEGYKNKLKEMIQIYGSDGKDSL